MNDRYSYLKSRTQRITRELSQIVESCDNILTRLQSPLIETARGKLNPDIAEETKVALLRKRTKDALIFLRDAVDKEMKK